MLFTAGVFPLQMFHQLSVRMAASTESVSAPANASASQGTLERHAIRVGIRGQGSVKNLCGNVGESAQYLDGSTGLQI